MTKPSALTPTMPTPTTTKAFPSITSSVIRRPSSPMTRPSALIPTLPMPTITEALPLEISSATRKQHRLLKKHANLGMEIHRSYHSSRRQTTTPRTNHPAWSLSISLCKMACHLMISLLRLLPVNLLKAFPTKHPSPIASPQNYPQHPEQTTHHLTP